MKTRYLSIVLTVILMQVIGSGIPAYSENTGTATNGIATGLEDQIGVAVTIYNANLGLVKDQRKMQLFQGQGDVRFMDVAAQIIPASVYIKSLVNPESLRVLEQNYEYDLLNPQKLLDKYVGKEVKLYSQNPYTEREEMVTATLLANSDVPIFFKVGNVGNEIILGPLANNYGSIFKIGNEVTFGLPGRIVFPGVPENLISKPTLVWLVENSLSSPQNVEASYLTNGINWRADYVVTLNKKDDQVDLSGWVTIDNKSGATYKNAKLKLVAGDIHRVQEEEVYEARMSRNAWKGATPPPPQFKEEEFFEYHIYTLQRPSTIKDNQTKQIGLVTAENIPVKKELVFQGARYYYYNRYEEAKANQKVGVYVEIANKKEHNLGIPLPKGIVRVYKHDDEGSLQFIGEDSIDHTPKDEKARIKVGDAFDVVGNRKQTDWKKLASDTFEASFEISLKNHKKEDVMVKVVEPIPGDWTMLSSSHEYKKTEAFAAEFMIPIPKDQETKLTYKVRMRY